MVTKRSADEVKLDIAPRFTRYSNGDGGRKAWQMLWDALKDGREMDRSTAGELMIQTGLSWPTCQAMISAGIKDGHLMKVGLHTQSRTSLIKRADRA